MSTVPVPVRIPPGVAARLDDAGPGPEALPPFPARDGALIAADGRTIASFARDEPRRIVIRFTRIHAW